MPVWNAANNIKRGSSQVIKMLRGGNSPWAAYNAATGGTVTTIPNYNGSGETWKTHVFTSNGTFTVTQGVGVFPFRVLVVGGGTGAAYFVGTPYPGGEVIANNAQALPSGSTSITIGGGGPGGQGSWNPGQPSYLGSIQARAGLSSSVTNNNITGITVAYGGDGSTQGIWGRGGMGAANQGGWGQQGIVIVAYRIA